MNDTERKVFCIGLSRTATTSLHFALVACGISSIHYPIKIATKWMNGNFNSQTTQMYQAFADLPVGVYFRQLHETHPNALFVYTRRDPEAWLHSIEKHLKTTPSPSQKTFLRDSIRIAAYGSIRFSRSLYLDRYLEHEDRVKSHFEKHPKKLLTLDIDKGVQWEPILRFLSLENPGVTFPHIKNFTIGRFAAVDSSNLGPIRNSLIEFLKKA